MINYKYGKLLVLKKDINYFGKNSKYICRCNCGKEISCFGFPLKNNNTTSCGCYNKKIITKHGMYNSPEYRAYTQMKQRCYNKIHKKYKNYGERGIKICNEWLISFDNFYQDMGNKPTKKHSIDRINVNGDYEKSNCRWATDYEQRANKQNTVIFELNGLKMHQNEWARKLGISSTNLIKQIQRNGFEYVYNRIINKQKKQS
jgi:hypothetical protein